MRVDLDDVRQELEVPTAGDRRAWQQIRELLERTVDENTFEIWLEPVELIAVDGEKKFVLATPPVTTAWTSKRFGRMLAACASRVGREVRFAKETERHAFGANARSRSTLSTSHEKAAG